MAEGSRGVGKALNRILDGAGMALR
jgi:hypothetical protein